MSKISRKLKRKKKAAPPPNPLLQRAIEFSNARNWQAADDTCREILRKNPKNHKALNILSVVLTNKPDLVQAEKYIKRAIQIKPNEHVYYSNLGLILKEQEKWQEAFSAFSRAFELHPRDDETLYNLGTVYQALRKWEDAKENYRKAITINPSHVQAHCALCNLLSRHEDGRDELLSLIDRMELLLTDADIAKKEQIYFELARVHDKIGKHGRVFEFLDPANRIFRKQFQYDVQSEKKLFASIEQIFTPDVLKEKEGNGIEDFSPVFIVGMPRSGTTLVEQILASHSQVEPGGELHFLNNVIMQSPHLAVPFRPDTIKLPNYSRIHQVIGSEIYDMAEAYLKATVSLRGENKHLTDKMPHNFIHVGMIKLLFPKGKIIHCRRHPLDNGLSLYMQHFKVLHPYIYSLEEIGEYYAAYSSLMEHWQRVLPGFMHEVSYEQLVRNPEAETAKLLEYCGLEWEKACLEFYTLDRVIKTASEGQADQPMYTTSITRWKKYEKYLQPLIDVFNKSGINF